VQELPLSLEHVRDSAISRSREFLSLPSIGRDRRAERHSEVKYRLPEYPSQGRDQALISDECRLLAERSIRVIVRNATGQTVAPLTTADSNRPEWKGLTVIPSVVVASGNVAMHPPCANADSIVRFT